MPHRVDIVNNKIHGTYFAAIYHTGSGKIKVNTISNTQAYTISCKNNNTEEGNTFIYRKNIIEDGALIPEISTGPARAPITFLSYENKPIKAIIKNNTIHFIQRLR